MNRFEHLVHTERREQGELSVERFGELWAESQTELLGDSVELTEGYRTWWSYIPHFIGSPGYVYAYAYGQLLALSVYRALRADRRGARPPLSGAARDGRLAQPRGARRDRRHRPAPTRASGRRGWTSSSASSQQPRRPPRPPGGWPPRTARAPCRCGAPGRTGAGGRSRRTASPRPPAARRAAPRACAPASRPGGRRPRRALGATGKRRQPACRGTGQLARRLAHPHRRDHRQVVAERDHRADTITTPSQV